MSDFASTGNFREILALARRATIALENIADALDRRPRDLSGAPADADLPSDPGAGDPFPSMEDVAVYNAWLRGMGRKGR